MFVSIKVQYFLKISHGMIRVALYRLMIRMAMRSKFVFLFANQLKKWDEV